MLINGVAAKPRQKLMRNMRVGDRHVAVLYMTATGSYVAKHLYSL